MSAIIRHTSVGDYYEPSPLGTVLVVAGTALGAYHGYKRNDSVGWALWWAFVGGLVPVVTIPVAIAQGFGERKVG